MLSSLWRRVPNVASERSRVRGDTRHSSTADRAAAGIINRSAACEKGGPSDNSYSIGERIMDLYAAMRTFVRVAETLSFTSVAKELGIAQSTVSKQVSALEEHPCRSASRSGFCRCRCCCRADLDVSCRKIDGTGDDNAPRLRTGAAADPHHLSIPSPHFREGARSFRFSRGGTPSRSSSKFKTGHIASLSHSRFSVRVLLLAMQLRCSA
jgi:hypothetical protein